MKLSQKLAKLLAEKREKAKGLLAKGDAATEAELKEVDDLISQIEQEETALKAQEKREQFEQDNETRLEGMKTTPANGLPHPSQTPNVEFGQKDGEIVVDLKT